MADNHIPIKHEIPHLRESVRNRMRKSENVVGKGARLGNVWSAFRVHGQPQFNIDLVMKKHKKNH